MNLNYLLQLHVAKVSRKFQGDRRVVGVVPRRMSSLVSINTSITRVIMAYLLSYVASVFMHSIGNEYCGQLCLNTFFSKFLVRSILIYVQLSIHILNRHTSHQWRAFSQGSLNNIPKRRIWASITIKKSGCPISDYSASPNPEHHTLIRNVHIRSLPK